MADGGADSFCDTSATADVSTDFSNDTACNGAVNPAFEDTEGLKSSDAKEVNGEAKKSEENNHSTNGELKSPTKDGLPPAEAVNLEMVTMSPYTNSIPVKKESTELDMTDPYDEYFVPVNQHKKYIRGEKLYVTQDKRENLAGSKKKCFCGFIAVLAIGAAIAILVAVLLTQENGNLPEGEARNYDKAGFGSKLIPTYPAQTPSSQPPPTTEMSQKYLKNVLEGELTIDNMGFTPGLSNSSSAEFKTLAISLEEEIKKALFDHQKLHYGASDISVKVIEFRSGSVIVTYRVGWRFKEGSDNPADPIDMEMLKSNLQKHLKENDGCLYNYRIPVSSIKSTRVIDDCQNDNNRCSNGCIFNETTLRTTCTCPYGLTLAEDEKTCVKMNLMETHGFDYPHHMMPSEKPVESSPEQQNVFVDDSISGVHDDYHHHHEDHEHHEDSEEIYEHHEGNEEIYEHGNEYEQRHDHDSNHSFNTSSDHPDIEDSSNDSEDSSHNHHFHHDFSAGNNFGTAELPPPVHPVEPSWEDHYAHSTEPSHVHPAESTNHTMEHLPDYPSESQSGEQSHEHSDNFPHDHPTSDNDSMHSLLPAVSEEPQEPKIDEMSHEQNLGYLPQPTEIPVQEDKESASDIEDSSMDHAPEHAEESEKSVSDSDTVGLLPPLSIHNASDSHMPPEYLPEYSTFADSPQETNTTENLIKQTTTESTPIETHVAVNNIEDSDVSEKNDKNVSEKSNNNEQPNSTEGFKTQSSSEEFPLVTHKPKEGELLLETNPSTNDTRDESREELIDHMPEMDKDKMESSSTTSSPIESELKTTEKHSNYPDVVNDIHTIEGNPYETERLNELPPSNETVTDMKDSTSVLNLTEKPIEHNAIETFREAKATDYSNSTSGEDMGNSTHIEMIDDSHKSSEMSEVKADELSSNVSPVPVIPSDNAIFVTPAPKEVEKNDSNSTVETEESMAVVHGSSSETQENESKEKVEKDSNKPSEEVASSSHEYSDVSDEKLVKTSDENEFPKAEDMTKISELFPPVKSNENDKDVTTTHLEKSDVITTMKPIESIDFIPHSVEKESDDEVSKKSDENSQTIYVTHPPDVSDHSSDKHTNFSKEDEMPMISVTEIPDLMGPFPVDTEVKEKPDAEKQKKTTDESEEKPDINKLLDDESNNLNSLEDDYDNDSIKGKYQKEIPGKSKLRKNFNVKEIYPHHNSSEKNADKFQSLSSEHPIEVSSSSSTTESNKESIHHLLSDEGYNTPSPLFTSNAEPSSTPSSTTPKTEKTTKGFKSDQGLESSEAYTTVSPLFHESSSSQPTTLKVEEITTTTPLIFDLFEGKKVDPKISEFDSAVTTEKPDKTSDHNNEMTTVIHEGDLMSETTPASINPDLVSATELSESMEDIVNKDQTELPDVISTMQPETSEQSSESAQGDETKSNSSLSSESLEKSTQPASNDMISSSTEPASHDKMENSPETMSMEDSMKSGSTSDTSDMEKSAELSSEIINATSKSPMVTEEPVTSSPTIITTVMTPNEKNSEMIPSEKPETISSTEATHSEINDSVVKLLMNSSPHLNSTLSNICASGQWTCLDGSGCIAPNSRCDSVLDCKDGSDEDGCQENGCPNNFQCKSGECLKRSLVCDSTPDCKDGSDEVNCDSWQCNFDEMQCSSTSKKCIPTVWKCDNIPHCPNNEDEYNCKDSCLNDEFFCPEGWCLPLAKKCDGTPDCTKGEDENNC